MKKKCRIALLIGAGLLIAAALAVAVMALAAQSGSDERKLRRTVAEAARESGTTLIPEAKAVELFDSAHPVKRVSDGRTCELPGGWDFYLPRDWRNPALFDFSTGTSGLRLISSRPVLLIASRDRVKPAGVVVRVKVRGIGRIAPFLRIRDNLEEKEFHEKPRRIGNLFFREYSFFFPGDNVYSTLNVGLDVRGVLEIASVSLSEYRSEKLENTSYFYGTVREVSPYPVPASSAYPDCLYALDIKVYAIRSGRSLPQHLVLLLRAFTDRRAEGTGHFKKGDRIRVKAIPFGLADKGIQSTQQADTLDLFDRERFFASHAERIEAFPEIIGAVPFKIDAEFSSPYDEPVNPPVEDGIERIRRKRIAVEQARVDAVLTELEKSKARINAAFAAAWKCEQARHTALADGKIWMHCGRGFYALAPDHVFLSEFSIAHNLAALRELKNYLAVHGVQFLIAVIPDASDIAARMCVPGFRQYGDDATAKAVQTLLANDIDAVYFADRVLDNAGKSEYLYYYPDDPHPMGGVQEAAAAAVAERILERFPKLWAPRISPKDFTWTLTDPRDGLRRPDRGDVGGRRHGEKVTIPQLLYRGEVFGPTPESSKILVIGNSFIQTPFPKARSFSGYLARALGYLPGEHCIPAHGPAYAILLDLYRNPEAFLKGKKICVLPIPAAHLREFFFLNLRKLDRELAFYAGRTAVGELSLPKTPQVELTGKDASLNMRWLELTRSGAMQLFMPKRERFYEFPAIAVPEQFRDGHHQVRCDFVLCFKGTAELRVNGVVQPLPVPHGINTYTLLLPLAKDRKELRLAVSSRWPLGAAAVRRATVYRAEKP